MLLSVLGRENVCQHSYFYLLEMQMHLGLVHILLNANFLKERKM